MTYIPPLFQPNWREEAANGDINLVNAGLWIADSVTSPTVIDFTDVAPPGTTGLIVSAFSNINSASVRKDLFARAEGDTDTGDAVVGVYRLNAFNSTIEGEYYCQILIPLNPTNSQAELWYSSNHALRNKFFRLFALVKETLA